ncbi:MAG: YceI family protein [Bdellovibrionales bacterium]
MKLVTLLMVLGFGAVSFGAEVDLKESQLIWTGTKVTGKHFGKMPFKSASVKVDKKSKVKSGVFIVDIGAFTVDDLKGKWANKFTKHVKSEDFFEVEKWPTAELKIKKMKKGQALGKLTIKGKTNPVKFTYTEKDDLYEGKLKFDRTKFGMVYGSGNFFKNLGDKTINDEITVDFKIKVKK